MAHGHHHHGDSMREYFVEQLLTILVCGLFGGTAVLMYLTNQLTMLSPQFHPFVLIGGIGVLLIVGLRSLAVWKEAGKLQAEGNHVHGPDCQGDDCNHVNIPGNDGNDQAHTHDHDHGHSHDLSWVFARMLILIFPVALYFLGLIPSNFSAAAQLDKVGDSGAIGEESFKELAKDAKVLDQNYEGSRLASRTLETKTGLKLRETINANGESSYEILGGNVLQNVRFSDLNDAAFDAAKREYFQGQTCVLEGRFKRLADKEFTLFRMKMTCCKADEVPLKVRIIVPQALSNFDPFDWVRVKGTIQFIKTPDQKQYVPVLMVAHRSDVQKGTPPANEAE